MATQTEHEEVAASGGRRKERSRSTVVGAGKKCAQYVLAGCVSDAGPGPVRDIVLVDFKLAENPCLLKTY